MPSPDEIEAAAKILSAACYDGCSFAGSDEMRSCVYPPCPCRTLARQVLEAAEDARDVIAIHRYVDPTK